MERATSIASNQSRRGKAVTVTFPEQLPREGIDSGPGCSELVTPNAIGLDPGQVILKLTQAIVFQPDQVVDIPFNVEYTASSGHKANHDMLRPNCRYVPLETPRFGRSMAVETIMKVNKKWSVCYHSLLKMANLKKQLQVVAGTELTVDYLFILFIYYASSCDITQV